MFALSKYCQNIEMTNVRKVEPNDKPKTVKPSMGRGFLVGPLMQVHNTERGEANGSDNRQSGTNERASAVHTRITATNHSQARKRLKVCCNIHFS